MLRDAFSGVQFWVFDLDHTLYPHDISLFDQIELKMTDWVMRVAGVDRAEADRLRSSYWRDHGTTLAGLMSEHDMPPEPFLTDVHDISFAALEPDPDLATHIADLPGRRIIYTNGTAPYAERVIEARGLSGLFDAIYGVEHAAYRPKPQAEAFAQVFGRDAGDPAVGAMFEDDPRNLAVPHALGMKTVHVAQSPVTADHVHHHTDDLTAFLSNLTR